MREMWKTDRCYAEWGVDGGDCSIIKYLSEVEHFCPPPVNINTTQSRLENEPEFERVSNLA